MLVLDPVLRSVGAADKMTQALSDRGVDFFIFDEIAESADTKAAASALNLAKNSHIQAVIAVGGGKTIEISSIYPEEDFVDLLLLSRYVLLINPYNLMLYLFLKVCVIITFL